MFDDEDLQGAITVERIKEWVDYIHRLDDECAHENEDRLHQCVLTAIAEGRCDDPSACAKAALQTLEIEFHRWCA